MAEGTEVDTVLSSEIAAIEDEIRDTSSDYWRSPDKRGHYRELLSRRDGVPTGDPARDAAAERGYEDRSAPEARQALAAMQGGDALVSWWDRAGGFEANLQRVQGVASVALDAIPDAGERQRLVETFDALPETAQAVLYSDMAMPAPNVTREAPPAAVSTFATTPEGAVLVQEWGHRAPRNVAVIKARMERLIDRLSEDDAVSFLDWFDGLSTEQARAVHRSMVP